MKSPQVLTLDENALDYVQTLLTNQLTNPEFSYTVSVNKSPVAMFSAAKSIKPFESVREMFFNDDSIYCIDVTFKIGKSKGGTRIILADADNEANFNPLELGGYPKYSTTGQQQREQEIVEREKMRWQNELLAKENESLKENVVNLKDQLKKAEEFSSEVEKLLTDMKGKIQDKGLIEQIGDTISKVASFAPGLLKNTPLESLAKTEANSGATLGNTVATPKTEAQPVAQNTPQYDQETIALCETLRQLKPYFSEFEFQDCFKLLGLIARYKPLIPDLYDLALSEVKRQTAIRQQIADRKQQREREQQNQEQKSEKENQQEKRQPEQQTENQQTEIEEEPELPTS